MNNRRPSLKILLIGAGCLVVLLLVAGFLFNHTAKSNDPHSNTKLANASASSDSVASQDSSTNHGGQSTKNSGSTVTATGILQLGLAVCDPHAKRLHVMVSGQKLLYVVEADGQVKTQLQSPQLVGRLVQLKGNVNGTQTVCSYKKAKPTPILKVSKIVYS